MEDLRYRLIGDSSTRVYHDPLCKYVENITDDIEVWFINAAQAHAEGYRGCQACNSAAFGDDESGMVPLPQQHAVLGDDTQFGPTPAVHSPNAFSYDCPQCGNKVQDHWKTCPYCGEALFEDII